MMKGLLSPGIRASNSEIITHTRFQCWSAQMISQATLAQALQRRKYYNEERPHGAIGQKTPIMLINHDGAASPPP
jgi:hypothetical protein